MGINLRRQYANDMSKVELMDRFKEQVPSEDCPCTVHVASHLVTLKILQDEARWWSPEMNLRIEDAEAGSQVNELVGPNPSTFTLAMFFVLFGAVVFIAAFILMLVQLQLGMSSGVALGVTTISALVVGGALTVLFIGRVKAKRQVKLLRKYAKKVIKSA